MLSDQRLYDVGESLLPDQRLCDVGESLAKPVFRLPISVLLRRRLKIGRKFVLSDQRARLMKVYSQINVYATLVKS